MQLSVLKGLLFRAIPRDPRWNPLWGSRAFKVRCGRCLALRQPHSHAHSEYGKWVKDPLVHEIRLGVTCTSMPVLPILFQAV